MSQRQASRQSVILLLRLALVAAAAWVWSGCTSAKFAADDIPKGKEIHIHMNGSKKNPEGPNPYHIMKVLPTDKGICRGNNNQTEDCKPTVGWQIKGKDLPKGWYLMVQLKADATKKCFSEAPFKIADDQLHDSGEVDAAACKKWDNWPYDIFLFNEKDQPKGTLDPLVVINH